MAQDAGSDPRIVDRTERNAVTSFRDHGGGDPVEQPSVTDRSNDLGRVEPKPALANSTLAERASSRQKDAKAVENGAAENKAVGRAQRKARK